MGEVIQAWRVAAHRVPHDDDPVDTELAEHEVQVFGVPLNAICDPEKGLFGAASSPVADGDAPAAR
jgi:hypothetical protein